MKNVQVLIVEDEGIVAMDLKMRLSRMGYTIAGMASTGEQAVQMAGHTEPDLILMDIKLKGAMDGIEAAEQIQSHVDIPVIFLTAYADEQTLQRAKVTGPAGYILKPFQEREVAIAIEMALYKHQMEKALRESEERYMLALRGASDGIWDWDLEKNMVYFSPRWKEIIGFEDSEIGSSLEDWLRNIHPEDRDDFQLALTHHIDGLTAHLECEHRMVRKDGSICWVRTRGLGVNNGSRRPHRLAGSISDITALKRAQEQLLHDAYHDTLTGLPNRALFLDRLERSMERYRRYHQDPLSVLFLDLDQFKVVNDSLGHQAGDDVLVQIAKRLKKLVRASDTISRFGGDEFVILLESAHSVAYACSVAERIAEVLNIPLQVEGREISTSVSIGIVMVTSEHLHASDVLRDADIAMYRAKALGKDRYEVFDVNLRHLAAERFEIENRLIGALERGELSIHYQPIYLLANRQIVGLEALLRLYPSDCEPIPPAVFIPVAEEIGLIKEIGDWVLLESCQKMSDWHRRFPNDTPLDLHVNISVKQLGYPHFVDRLQEILEITQLDPAKLKLEFTETVFIENIEQLSIQLDQLKMLGVHLLIDDFGTGYSSLGYVRRFPIDTIKIDRSFIFPVEGNGKNAEIVKAVLLMANQLGLSTVAEGIETEEQADFLTKMKCHFGQGFLFSKPLETRLMEQLLEDNMVEA